LGESAISPGWRKSSYSGNGGSGCVEVGLWRKSSHSGNGGGECVEAGTWRKSSHSGNGGGGCVEAGSAPGVVLIRDTKNHGAGPVLRVSAETWRAFTRSLRA
jgi:hypothetical protein